MATKRYAALALGDETLNSIEQDAPFGTVLEKRANHVLQTAACQHTAAT